MKKIKLTKEEVTALKKSIKHWEKDIIKYLEKGWVIKPGLFNSSCKRWAGKNRTVKCYSHDCELCNIFECEDCVYNRYYGLACEDYDINTGKHGHWNKFFNYPTLRNAIKMKESLERILKNQKL